MSILVSDSLIRQTSKKNKITTKTINSIYREMDNLRAIEKSGHNSMREYLKKQNGKKLKGVKRYNNIFKYRLNSGDRILYTYADNISKIRDDEHKNDLVILKYAKHDDQGDIKLSDLEKLNKTLSVEAYLEYNIEQKDIIDMGIEGEEELDEICFGDFESFHSFYVIDEKDPNLYSSEELDVYLTNEQNDIVEEFIYGSEPMLITGGAGTGKTVIALHILNDMQDYSDNIDRIYFTQSNVLVKNAKKKYNYLSNMTSKKSGDTLFYNLNQYCIERLNKKHEDFVEGVEDFKRFIYENNYKCVLNNNKLSIIDVWTEIRGVIKGGLNNDFRRVTYFNQQKVGACITEILEENNCIKRRDNNKKLFSLNLDFIELIDFGSMVDRDTFSQIEEMIKLSKSIDHKIRMLSKEEYLNLSDDNTIVSKDKREIIYGICENYDKWLIRFGKYDENDLVREMMRRKNDQYDLVVIDEVQDYTELQIYYMCCYLAKDKNKIIMDGDIHQIINPNVFNENRFKKLFSNLKIKNINSNFRSTKEIIDYTNAISELRRVKIGRRSSEVENQTESVRNGKRPMYLKYSLENMNMLIDNLLNFPRAMILVPNIETKDKLIDNYGVNKYKEKSNDIISTVIDIKGMEYKYIVCYNLIGEFEDEWTSILNDRSVKRNTKYRFYFNLLYVAITRAQEFLCIINEKSVKELDEYLKKYYDTLLEFNPSFMGIEELSNTAEAWLEQAEMYMNNGRFKEAKESLLKGNGDEKKLWRCDMEIAREEKNYKKAIELALILNDGDMIKDYHNDIDKEDSIYKLSKIYLNPNSYSKKNGYKENDIVNLIKDAFSKYNCSMQQMAMNNFLKLMDDNLMNIINGLRRRG